MAAGERDLEPAPRLELAADLGEVGDGERSPRGDRAGVGSPAPRRDGLDDEVDPRRHRDRPPPGSPPDELDRIAERLDADGLDPVDERGLVDAVGRAR